MFNCFNKTIHFRKNKQKKLNVIKNCFIGNNICTQTRIFFSPTGVPILILLPLLFYFIFWSQDLFFSWASKKASCDAAKVCQWPRLSTRCIFVVANQQSKVWSKPEVGQNKIKNKREKCWFGPSSTVLVSVLATIAVLLSY